ncbi:MAG TPA: glycosyl hydrolase, partial [Acidobacteria bacterium]|nr:glycosyl hydrolase [Acidobacteriota bacterium]
MIISSRHRPPLATALAVLLSLTAEGLAAAPAPAKTERSAAGTPAGSRIDPQLWKAWRWREVGPYRGGRSAAVAGLPGDRKTYYFGATGGGVWKTGDAGLTWKNVSDGFFGGSIGAVAVSAWDPNVVYAGGGEVTVRGNVSQGDGVWKSTDAGRTWKHMGLGDARHIPRLVIHPKNPDLVYAAVLGHLFGPNEMRGVYRSKDGGTTWERVHFVSPEAGAVDLTMDPTNPRVLYASIWRVRRTPWSLESGGPGSGLWKSTDGGDTWNELTHHPGLPKGTLGIIGITVSRSNPDNLYAIVEAADGGVFRSRDAGATWTRTNEDRSLRQRAWYYSRIYADPADEEAVWVLNVQLLRSKDGGKSFSRVQVPHADNHDLWIDPADPLRMIEANDGGANVTSDGGATWTPQNNQPTAQIYRVSTDNHIPYRLLGAQQDSSALRIASRSPTNAGIGFNDWEGTAGGESGHVVADPDDPEVVFGGSYGGLLQRRDHRTQELRDVNPWPDDPMGWGAGDLEVRFQWNFPLLFSPHDGDTLYAAGQRLFRSTDEGQSWTAISPDLTRNDKSKQGPSGGPITKDNTSVEYYCTIFAVAESPLEKGVLWTGSDDGLLHVSRDGGATWKNVTPPGLPEWSLINSLEASPFEKGGLYVAATRYKLDDLRPYLFKTTDYGATWTRIDRGIDPASFTRVIRADP